MFQPKEFKSSISFLSLVISFLIIGSIVLFSNDKATIHVFFNSFHHPASDVFFKYYTHIADGLTVVLVAIALAFIKIRYGLITLLGLISSSAITHFLKQIVFSEHYRPARFFEEYPEVSLHFVDGVTLHCCHSFPSGHTTAGFALFAALSIAFPKNKMAWIFGLLAILVGYSRVYLSLHHFEDIVAGAFVGTAFTMLMAYLLSRSSKKWLELPLHKVMNKK
jgi:membrane-associated phospholipid phosphatase